MTRSTETDPAVSAALGWRGFWSRETPLYAGDRHKRAHYALIARDLAELVEVQDAHALDHGCGEALDACRVAAHCGKLYLFDVAPNVRAKLAARKGTNAQIGIIDDETLEGIPDASLDLVIANSLLQYVSADELSALLYLWRRKLKEEGRLLIADVVSPNASVIGDACALLAFGAREGFFSAALISLARSFFSDYPRLRKEFGFATYDPGELGALLGRHGFSCERLARNIGHNQGRMTFIARKVGSGFLID